MRSKTASLSHISTWSSNLNSTNLKKILYGGHLIQRLLILDHQNLMLNGEKLKLKNVKWGVHRTVKSTFNVSLGINEFEHYIEENRKWRKFDSEIIDLGSLKFNMK
jgi:hypothetical protein